MFNAICALSVWPAHAKEWVRGEVAGKEGGAKQMKDFQTAKKEREEATKWLIAALNTSQLAVPLLVLIAQQISGCLFTKEAVKAERVKYSSWLHKQCQHTLLVYVDFLWRRLPVAEYTKRLPSLLQLVQKLNIEPTLALLIQRPALRWSDSASALGMFTGPAQLLARAGAASVAAAGVVTLVVAGLRAIERSLMSTAQAGLAFG